jgi:hypothetical protein
MKVKELREILDELNPEAEVFYAEPIRNKKLSASDTSIGYTMYYQELQIFLKNDSVYFIRKKAIENMDKDLKITELLMNAKRNIE